MKNNLQDIYRIVFWLGYTAVLLTAFISIAGNFSRIKLGPEVFQVRLDHLLHLFVYFLICIYYLFGLRNGFALFETNTLRKFLLLVLFLATVTEVVQLWVPERAFNVFDLISNVAGVTIGAGVIRMAQRRDGLTA